MSALRHFTALSFTPAPDSVVEVRGSLAVRAVSVSSDPYLDWVKTDDGWHALVPPVPLPPTVVTVTCPEEELPLRLEILYETKGTPR